MESKTTEKAAEYLRAKRVFGWIFLAGLGFTAIFKLVGVNENWIGSIIASLIMPLGIVGWIYNGYKAKRASRTHQTSHESENAIE